MEPAYDGGVTALPSEFSLAGKTALITGQLIVVDGGNGIAEERRFARGDS